jgi:hypothetical protein
MPMTIYASLELPVCDSISTRPVLWHGCRVEHHQIKWTLFRRPAGGAAALLIVLFIPETRVQSIASSSEKGERGPYLWYT